MLTLVVLAAVCQQPAPAYNSTPSVQVVAVQGNQANHTVTLHAPGKLGTATYTVTVCQGKPPVVTLGGLVVQPTGQLKAWCILHLLL